VVSVSSGRLSLRRGTGRTEEGDGGWQVGPTLPETSLVVPEEVLQRAQEPNVRAIATFLRDKPTDLLKQPPAEPSMEALACSWAAQHSGGVRVVERR